MGITYTRAPTVSVDDPITSTQFATLAAAFNDRLRAGLGDPAWRIHFWWLNLFRQVRNPDETFTAYPPQDEFFEVYQHIDPGEGEWPLTGPGDPEGSNVANPMMAFVWGSEAADIFSEWERFAELIWPQGEPSARDAWNAGKQQRGGVDPETGGMASPALDVGRQHYRLRTNEQSPFGNSYGGFLPLPAEGLGCEDPDPGDDIPPRPNYLYKFTNLSDCSTIEYDGSCQPAVFDLYPTHVAYIARLPWAYYVFLNNGDVDVLLSNVWVEGPYEGEARLRKSEGDHMQRTLWNFVREFRGSENQRAQPSYHLQHAFDFQEFFTRQYRLAPQIGVEDGEFINPLYPHFEITSSSPAGTAMIETSGYTDTHVYHPGFVFAGALVEASGLVGTVDLEFRDGETVLARKTIVPETDGTAAVLVFPDAGGEALGPRLRIVATSAVVFGESGGRLDVETLEVLAYKPQMQDAYVYIRGATCIPSQPDGTGNHTTDAEVPSDDYFRYGCIINRSGIPGIEGLSAAVNPNAVFDAMRRFSKHVRVVRRQDLVGYAVEDGKSVLWFNRYAYGLSGGITADVWDGVGPQAARLVSGDVRDGVEYIVKTGDVEYNGTAYKAGDRFTGVAGNGAFGGGGEVYEYDGIKHTAPPQGYTNEWLLGVEFLNYHPSESSLWKPSAYTDYFNHLVQRCHFYSPEVASEQPVLWHFSFGERVGSAGVVAAEAPSGYNYVTLETAYLGLKNANLISCDGLTPGTPEHDACVATKQAFYKSCRVYEPDVEIESVVMDGDEVKVTLTGRLHYCEGDAPSSIDRDVATWDKTALRAEPFRSHENGIREYLVNQSVGTNCATLAGDAGANSSVFSNPDNPFGACYPKIRLTKLVPVPYADDNDTQQSTDTRFEHDAFAQMELYLRCMCEGFVDGATSEELSCSAATSSVYDFSFTSLCLQAFGNRWLSAFNFTSERSEECSVKVPGSFASDERPDNPQGFGPCPNTIARAAVFNQLAAAVNLLTTVRVMLPATVYGRVDNATGSVYVEALNGDGSVATCVSPTSPQAVYADLIPPYPTEWVEGSWEEVTGLSPSISASITGDCDGSGRWEVLSENQRALFKWELTDPDAELALPEAWRDMLQENAAVLVTINIFDGSSPARGRTAVLGEAETCAGTVFHVGDGTYLTFPQVEPEETVCRFVSGFFDLPELRKGNLFRMYNTGGGGTECPGGPEIRWDIGLLSDVTPLVTVPLTP